MANATIAERLAAGLVALGYREIESTSRKYRTFQKVVAEGSRPEHVSKRFVGKSGALRGGLTASNSHSYDGMPYKAMVLEKGDLVLRLKAEAPVNTKDLLGSLGGNDA